MPPTPMRPEDLFKQEKERATSAAKSLHAKLLAEAKAAFDKLMAEGQAARKSGRPRKHPLPPLKTGSALRSPNDPPPRFAPQFTPAAPAAHAAPSKFVPTPVAVVAVAAPKVKAKAAAKKSRPKAKPKAKAKAKKKKR